VTAEGCGQQGDKLVAAGKAALVFVGFVLAGQAVEAIPGEEFHSLFEQRSLVAHGIRSRGDGTVGKPHHRVESMLCACTSGRCSRGDKNHAGQQ
jgi:hypothetical protein